MDAFISQNLIRFLMKLLFILDVNTEFVSCWRYAGDSIDFDSSLRVICITVICCGLIDSGFSQSSEVQPRLLSAFPVHQVTCYSRRISIFRCQRVTSHCRCYFKVDHVWVTDYGQGYLWRCLIELDITLEVGN